MRSVIAVAAVGFLVCGCPEKRVETIDAGLPEIDAGLADAGEPVDAGPPPPATLEPAVTVGFKDAGTATLIANAEIDSPATITIAIPIKLKDFRLRLMDWRDQIVVSDDELMADGKTLLVTPAEPLKTGRSYSLILDSELGPVVTDESGRTFNDWELAFRIAGEVQPDKSDPKKPLKKKK
ncbi:MAG: hypothetical protein QM817_12425 [Archangium sp.]